MFLPTFFYATKLDRIVVDAYSSANAKQRAVFCTSSLSQIKNTINHLFHEITLTSASWAFTFNIHALLPVDLASQIRMVWSTEHDAKT